MVNIKWKEAPVKDLVKIETGSRNTEDKNDDGQYPFFVRSQTVERIDSFHYDCEAVLTAGDGVGTGKVFHYINGKFDAHQRVYVMSQFKQEVLGKYFYYWFSKNFYAEVAKYTAKSSVDSVRRQMIAGMVISLPSAEEQEKIVGVLSDVDTLITDLQKLIRKKKDIRQGTMQMLVTGKKRLDGFDGEWVKINLSKNSKLKARIGWQGLTTAEYLDEGYSYLITGTDFKDGQIDWNGCHYVDYNRYEQDPNIQVSNGDLLLTKDGTIGKVAYACLDYIILHELTHLITRKHDATFIAHMDRHMPNWREIRKELNDSRLDYYEAQDESPLQKLIDQSRYDDIRDAAIAYIQEDHSGDTKRLSVIDMEIENVIHIEQPEDGVIAFDVIASCDVEMPSASRKGYFNERWLKIHCQVTLGIDMSGFRIMSVGNCEPQEESDNDRLSGELVPIISRDQFEGEAEKFLTRYCPEALDKPMRVPIETIASDMKLQVIEDVPLSDDLTYFGTIIFDNGNVLDKHRKITIRNAKRGTVYLDPRVSYERSCQC